MNQKLEQYLRAFYSSSQDDWATLIPYMEYAHNAHQHSVMKKSLFELLHRYQPQAYSAIIVYMNVFTANAHLKAL